MKKIIITIPLLLLFLNLTAQTTVQKCKCCTEKYKQFNFWLGDWEVFDTSGIKIGENKVLTVQDSCVIQENWVSKNLTGTSYNYYNISDSSWNQVWIDNTGSVLELKGNFYSGKMILKSEVAKGANGIAYYNRITWELNKDSTVSQTWDILDDKNQILSMAFKGIYKRKLHEGTMDAKATGIGGIFIKCKDPLQMKEWYRKHLGFKVDQYGTSFEWWQGADSTKKGFTQWSPFAQSTKYFEPSTKDFMINYRVQNIDELVKQMKKDGVTVTDSIETYEYGKFVHVMDSEGNKIELWEPVDIEYEKIAGGRTK